MTNSLLDLCLMLGLNGDQFDDLINYLEEKEIPRERTYQFVRELVINEIAR